MNNKKLGFENSFTTDLLYKSLHLVKYCHKSISFGLNSQLKFAPISRLWFSKVSARIVSGTYKYKFSKNNKLNENKTILDIRSIKNLIIETTFVNALLPFFSKETNFNLTEYL